VNEIVQEIHCIGVHKVTFLFSNKSALHRFAESW